MKLVPGGATDQGQVRDTNEDGYVVDRRLQLFAVADGMGGHRAGEIASATALEALRATVASGTGLGDAITNANEAVYGKAAQDSDLQGMGTTLTAVVPDGNGVLVGHVGDSRAYLLRDGELRQLTRDDTYVQSLVDDGLITADAARHHPHKSLITASVQGRAFSASLTSLQTRGGDRLLLCSDGLSDIVTDENIAEVLRHVTERQACAERLVKLALQAGAPDNVTVVLADLS
jgi:protein phosphatase